MKQFRLILFITNVFLISSLPLEAQKKIKASIESHFMDKSVDFGLGIKGKLQEQAILLKPDIISLKIDNKQTRSTRIFLKPGTHSLKLKTYYKNYETPQEFELVSEFKKGKFYVVKSVQSINKQSVTYLVNEISKLEYEEIVKNLDIPKVFKAYDVTNNKKLDLYSNGEISDLFKENMEYDNSSFLSPKLSPNKKLLALPFNFSSTGGRGQNNMLTLIDSETKTIQNIVIPRGEPFTDFMWINDTAIIYNYRYFYKEKSALKRIDLNDKSFTPETLIDLSHISSSLYDPPTYDQEREYIYFSIKNKENKKYEIYQYNIQTEKLVKIINGEYPILYPDGNMLLYVFDNDFYTYDIENKKSNKTTDLSNHLKKYKSIQIAKPSISPDGNKIAFNMYSEFGKKEFKWSIFTMNKNGTQLKEIIYTKKIGDNTVKLENPEWVNENTICFEVPSLFGRRQILKYTIK